jgi:hypothetical protein
MVQAGKEEMAGTRTKCPEKNSNRIKVIIVLLNTYELIDIAFYM